MHRPDIPRECDRLIARCLRVKPDDRYPTANALLQDARRLADGDSSPPARSAWDLVSGPSLLLSKSGDVVRQASSEWRLILAASTAALMLFMLLAAIWSPATDGGAHVANDAMDSANHFLGAGSDSAGQQRPLRRVTIRVLEGEATVVRDALPVGTTPYQLEAPLGAEVSLLLRRPGCDDTPIRLRITEGLDAVMESMRRCRAR